MIDIKGIVPGVICFFDCGYMAEDIRIQTAPADHSIPMDSVRPFVCIYTKTDLAVWLMMTRSFHPHRIKIKDEWKTGQGKNWKKEFDMPWILHDSYLQDVRRVWYGPKRAFHHASISRHADKKVIGRRMIKPDGVAYALAEAKACNPQVFEDTKIQQPLVVTHASQDCRVL